MDLVGATTSLPPIQRQLIEPTKAEDPTDRVVYLILAMQEMPGLSPKTVGKRLKHLASGQEKTQEANS